MWQYNHTSYPNELFHYGVKGMKWGVRRTREQLGYKKGVVKKYDSDRIPLEDTKIYRSVGAKVRNYNIEDKKTGEIFHFVEGTKIQNSQVFAGKGTSHPLHEETALGLCEEIGGTPSKWQHCKGNGVVDFYGEEREAEVHWFQEETVGKHKFKIKEWLED